MHLPRKGGRGEGGSKEGEERGRGRREQRVVSQEDNLALHKEGSTAPSRKDSYLFSLHCIHGNWSLAQTQWCGAGKIQSSSMSAPRGKEKWISKHLVSSTASTINVGIKSAPHWLLPFTGTMCSADMAGLSKID